MSSRRRQEPEAKPVERVAIVDRRSGTICTVGDNVLERYIGGRKPVFERYDEEKYAAKYGERGDDDEFISDPDDDGEIVPDPSKSPAKPSTK